MDDAPNLVLVGPMGAGKSAVGARVAARLSLPFVDLDAAIARDAGASIGELFAREGEAGFREREHHALEAALDDRRKLVAAGGGVVLDARNRQLLLDRAWVVWLQASPATQLRRLAGSSDRPLLAVADPAAALEALAIAREPLYREVAALSLATDDCGEVAAADALAGLVHAHWPPVAAA